MPVLALRVMLVPALMGTSIWATRKWGARVGGVMLGLPLMSGPVSVLLFLQYGPRFAASAAHSTLIGFVAGGAFCATYASLTARRPWYQALVAALAAFLLTAWVLEPLRLDWVRTTLLVLGTLALLARSVRRPANEPEVPRARKRELLLQLAAAGTGVFLLTTFAGGLGSHVAGLLATVPVVSCVVATSSLIRAGQGAATQLLRGAVAGSWGGVSFFAVAGVLLTVAQPAAAYATATAAALAGAFAGSRLMRAG